MGVATEILAMRYHKFSSVERLEAAIERLHTASSIEKMSARSYQVDEAADLVLVNVAAHAAEVIAEQGPTIRKTRRRTLSSRRKHRNFDSNALPQQRKLVFLFT